MRYIRVAPKKYDHAKMFGTLGAAAAISSDAIADSEDNAKTRTMDDYCYHSAGAAARGSLK